MVDLKTNDFVRKELSKEFLSEYLQKSKIDKAISMFCSSPSIKLSRQAYSVLKNGFGFMEIFLTSLNSQYDPCFTRSLVGFMKSELDVPLEHSYIPSFGKCMWESASLIFNSPFDCQQVDISDSPAKLKCAFDLFGSEVVMDLEDLINKVYAVNEDYNFDHVIDILYCNKCPGYRGASIMDGYSNNLTYEEISKIPYILLGKDMLYGSFIVEAVIVDYDGIDSFISSFRKDKSKSDSFLEVLAELIKYSCPQYINISKPKIVSDDDLFKLGFDDVSPGYKIAFLAFSDSCEECEDERSADCKTGELYRIWNTYMHIESFLGR